MAIKDYFLTHILAISVLLLLLLILWLITKSKSSRHKNESAKSAPEFPGGWPIIGHLHLLGGGTTLARTLAAMADREGPIFLIRLGIHPTVVISSAELVKDCFTTNDIVLASRPKSKHGVYLGYNFAAFGFAEYGSYWREMRKLTMLEVLSTRRIESLKHVQVSEVETLIRDLYQLWNRARTSNNTNCDGPVKVVLNEWLEHLTLNIITRMIAGKRYFGSTNEDSDGEQSRHIRRVIKEFMLVSGFPAVSDLIPFMGWTDLFGAVKIMKRVGRELDVVIGRWVEEHKLKNRDGINKQQQDFIDVMLCAIEDETMFGYSRDTIIKATVSNIIVAGSDTTSLNLTWVLTLLLANPQAMVRAQQELDLSIGRNRWVQDTDIDKLPYLQAIVKETLRLYPPGPLSVPHEATRDCIINGYLIPKSTRIFINLWKLHRDPILWRDPDRFNPDRFLGSGVDASGQHFQFIPFGSGRRSCPGAAFALRVTHLTLARLLQGFEIMVPSGMVVDLTEGLGVTLPKATPLDVVIKPRLDLELYES